MVSVTSILNVQDTYLAEVKHGQGADAHGGQDDGEGGGLVAGTPRQTGRQEPSLGHAQQLEGVAAHLRLELPNLAHLHDASTDVSGLPLSVTQTMPMSFLNGIAGMQAAG